MLNHMRKIYYILIPPNVVAIEWNEHFVLYIGKGRDYIRINNRICILQTERSEIWHKDVFVCTCNKRATSTLHLHFISDNCRKSRKTAKKKKKQAMRNSIFSQRKHTERKYNIQIYEIRQSLTWLTICWGLWC